MAEPSPLRRSGRKRQANRKYSFDLTEELPGLDSDSNNDEKIEQPADATKADNISAVEQEHDVEYTEDQDEAPDESGNVSLTAEDDDEEVAIEPENDIDYVEDQDEAPNNSGNISSSVEADDDEVAIEQVNDVEYVGDQDGAPINSGNVSPAAEDDVGDANSDADANELPPLIINDRDSEALNQSTPKVKTSRYQVRAKKDPKNIVRSRGLIELSSKNPSKEDMLKFMAGGHPQDWVDFLRTKDRWLTDPTLPTKADSKRGKEGMCHHFSHTKEKREMEATIGWDWYYDQGGRELFAKRQKTQILTPDEGRGYIPKPVEQSHKFLMGPYGNQKLFSLKTGHSMYLNDAWEPTHETNQGSTKPGEVRDGWMLNLGTSIKCLDWATNQDGDIQYLAVATAQPKPNLLQPLSEVSPAYTPSAPIRSCIQMWEFPLGINPPDHKTLPKSPRKPPALRFVICTEWGDIKQLKWCQVPRTFRDNDFAAGKIPLGLLASVWSDGLVRILDVSLDKNRGAIVSYVKYDEPAFKAWAPNTLCTCVTWLSASMIAVGFANGFLAIWDISQETPPSPSPSPSSPPTQTPPPPYLYHPLHQSYILALTTAYPLSPHLLSTSSVDGFTRLTDLRSPTFAESTSTSRSRNTSPLLAFSPFTLSVLSTEENDFARLFPLRSFHSTTVFARATASPCCLAVNNFHPCVLIGCADGGLVATNPIPRVWNRKWGFWQQVVFRQEWTGGKADDGKGEGEGEGKYEGKGSISRITESYQIIQTNKSKENPKPRPKPPPQSHSSPSSAKPQLKHPPDKQKPPPPSQPPSQPPMTTIYPPETALTQVVWNPNLRWGGWMAAGMGSGGVRVQDLAV